MLNSIVNHLLHFGGIGAYSMIALLCFGETALFLGFVLPGETAVVLGGVLAERHQVNLIVMLVVVAVAAILGDSVGYLIGYTLRKNAGNRKFMERRNVKKTVLFIHAKGAWAVFIGRFMAVFRTLVPGIAGVSEMHYKKFLIANATGGLIWAIGYCLAGFALGSSYEKVLHGAGVASYILIALFVVCLVVFALWRKAKEKKVLSALSGVADERGD
jgi:membrane protein DedA with SNARE-associated domain